MQAATPQELFRQPKFFESNASSQISLEDSPPRHATSIEQHLIASEDKKLNRKKDHLDIEEKEKEIDLNLRAIGQEERKQIQDQVQLVLDHQDQKIEGAIDGAIKSFDSDTTQKIINEKEQKVSSATEIHEFVVERDDIADILKSQTQKLLVTIDQDPSTFNEQQKGQDNDNILIEPNEEEEEKKTDYIEEPPQQTKQQSYLSVQQQESLINHKIFLQKFQTILEESQIGKKNGNESVKNKQYDQAINQYVDALSKCHPIRLRDCPGELIDSFVILNVQLLNNLAFCYYNIGQFDQCIQSALQVLQVEENNPKALYRIALAYEKKNSIDEAWKYICLAKKYDKKNSDIINKYQELNLVYSELNQKSKKNQQDVYKKMFSQDTQKNPEEQNNSNNQKSAKNLKIQKNSGKVDVVKQGTIQIFSSQALISLAVSSILATSATKYLLKENPTTLFGLANAGIMGCGLFSAWNVEKTWKSLAICALSSGIMSLLLVARQKQKI